MKGGVKGDPASAPEMHWLRQLWSMQSTRVLGTVPILAGFPVPSASHIAMPVILLIIHCAHRANAEPGRGLRHPMGNQFVINRGSILASLRCWLTSRAGLRGCVAGILDVVGVNGTYDRDLRSGS